jgi:hypothetical protein
MLCLIAGFGLGMYEHDLRWQIVHAVHSVRPDLGPFVLCARVGSSARRSEVLSLYRAYFPNGSLLKRRWIVLFAAPASFALGAIFLVIAFTHS